MQSNERTYRRGLPEQEAPGDTWRHQEAPGGWRQSQERLTAIVGENVAGLVYFALNSASEGRRTLSSRQVLGDSCSVTTQSGVHGCVCVHACMCVNSYV